MFTPHFRHSKFFTSHPLTFNPDHEKHELIPSAGIRSHLHYFYFVKRVKPKPAMIKKWLHKTNNSRFVIYYLFFPTEYNSYTKKPPHLIHNDFWPLFKIWLSDSMFQCFLDKWPHIVMRYRSWMASLSTYLGLVSQLTRFTLCQPSSWTWLHPAMNHLVFSISWRNLYAKTFGTSLSLY